MTSGLEYEAQLPDEYRGGVPDSFSVRIDSITLHGGSQVSLPAPGVTAVVGANNVGKSTLLRHTVEHLSQQQGQVFSGWRLVAGVQLSKEGSGADALAWLGRHAHFVTRPGGSGFVRLNQQQPWDGRWLGNLWVGAGHDRLAQLSQFLVHYAETQTRLGQVQGVNHRADIGEPPQHPMHYLQDSPELLHQISQLSEDIFREPLLLDRLSGLSQLRVGRTTVSSPPVDAVTPEYREALIALPTLADQGDGMRSLLGLVLPIVTASYPIVVVDEPEAFLHPPQAAALGKSLAELAKAKNLQILLATHDRNIVIGLLEAGVDVSIVRLSRFSNRTTAKQLDAKALRELWSHPALRYSNLLDGLFHHLVVLGEADQDCRFYAAALDSANFQKRLPLPPAEVLFVPSGGKDAMPRLRKALAALDVPLVASPDLDILNDEAKIRALVEAFGADWAEFAASYAAATSDFRAPREHVRGRDVKEAIMAVLDPALDQLYTAELRHKVEVQLRARENPWQALKSYGELAFKGKAAVAAKTLLEALDAIGILCVRVGELENFAPTLGVAKGPGWLPAALDARAHTAQAAVQHARRLVEVGYKP